MFLEKLCAVGLPSSAKELIPKNKILCFLSPFSSQAHPWIKYLAQKEIILSLVCSFSQKAVTDFITEQGS